MQSNVKDWREPDEYEGKANKRKTNYTIEPNVYTSAHNVANAHETSIARVLDERSVEFEHAMLMVAW